MIDLGGDVTGNGISKLVFTILSAVAEAERDRTRERITDVKRDQRARGRFLGGSVPFGYRLNSDGSGALTGKLANGAGGCSVSGANRAAYRVAQDQGEVGRCV